MQPKEGIETPAPAPSQVLPLRDQVIYRYSTDSLERMADEISDLINRLPDADRATGHALKLVIEIQSELVDLICNLRQRVGGN